MVFISLHFTLNLSIKKPFQVVQPFKKSLKVLEFAYHSSWVLKSWDWKYYFITGSNAEHCFKEDKTRSASTEEEFYV